MKTTLNALLVAALAILAMRSIGQKLKPSTEILATDGGLASREKYLAVYRQGMRQAAADFAVRIESGEFPDSMAMVTAWAKAMGAAGKAASVGVDRRMTALAKDDDPQAWARWVREFAQDQ